MVTKKEVNKKEEEEAPPMIVNGELCPFCNNKTLTLIEQEKDVPFFGKTYLFSMNCKSCGYHKADIEADEEKEPCRYTIEVDSEEDMKIRVVKSSFGSIKMPHVGSIESGEASNGYITNIEGILNRMKKIVESVRDEAEDKEDQKKAKNIIKKLNRVIWGQEKLKITIEDQTGNSAIISDKAIREKIKKK